jgi:hypothetical protein
VSPTLRGAGLAAQLPQGWEGRITKLPVQAPVVPFVPAVAPPSASAGAGSPGASRASGGQAATPASHPSRPMPFMHLANFPLPKKSGTFGGGAVELMAAHNAFIALVEFSAECRDTPLFARRPLPRHLRPSMFHPKALQRILDDQAGLQVFLTTKDRAFCLYVVLGSYRRSRLLVPDVNAVLTGITISADAGGS